MILRNIIYIGSSGHQELC